MSTKTPTEVIYPETDGQPMAENTVQYEWIVKIKGSLDALYPPSANVFVAGDLFWYPVKGHPEIRTAPDTMVVFGRPKGHRQSYRQWDEAGISPQVIFEVRSPSNSDSDLDDKRAFYEKYGVEEYYLYDPDIIALDGWLRSGKTLAPIPNMQGWVSPRCQIRFDMSSGDLVIYYPDGRPFLTYQEVVDQHQQALDDANRARDDARQARDDARQARDDARKAEDEKDLARKQTQEAEERAEKLAGKLRALGIDPDA